MSRRELAGGKQLNLTIGGMMASDEVLQIHTLLAAAYIQIGMTAANKEEALSQLLDLVAHHPAVSDYQTVRAQVFRREAMLSTGVGKGLGLPHAKTDAVTDTVAAFATVSPPIAYEAFDDAPVELLFLLVGPNWETSPHVKVLSRISLLMNQEAFRQRLQAAATPEAVLTAFREAELQLLAD